MQLYRHVNDHSLVRASVEIFRSLIDVFLGCILISKSGLKYELMPSSLKNDF